MLVLTFARLLFGAFTLMIVMIGSIHAITRAAPYDDAGLRDLLLSSDCAMPCFLGIRPSLTTRDEAILILQNHEWIAFLLDHGSLVQIYWSVSAPTAFIRDTPGTVVTFSDEVVNSIQFYTFYTQGDFALSLSQQHDVEWIPTRARVSMHAYYADLELRVFTASICPTTVGALWRSRRTYIVMPITNNIYPYGRATYRGENVPLCVA